MLHFAEAPAPFARAGSIRTAYRPFIGAGVVARLCGNPSVVAELCARTRRAYVPG